MFKAEVYDMLKSLEKTMAKIINYETEDISVPPILLRGKDLEGSNMSSTAFSNILRDLHDLHTLPKPRSLCPLCQKSYKTSDLLRGHIRLWHGYTRELTQRLLAQQLLTQVGAECMLPTHQVGE